MKYVGNWNDMHEYLVPSEYILDLMEPKPIVESHPF